MDKRTRMYGILGTVLVAESVVIQIVKHLGITTLPMWLNILWTIAYYAPIIAILYMLGDDKRIKKGWRVVCRFLSGFTCVSGFVGLVLELIGF